MQHKKAARISKRVHKELKHLASHPVENTRLYKNPNDPFHFILCIIVNGVYNDLEGVMRPCAYDGGIFFFELSITSRYPLLAPKLKCLSRIFHPNIEINMDVCLDILYHGWTPCLQLR